MVVMFSFGAWLRDNRKAAGLTQGQLAKRAKISTSYVSTIERQAKHPITEAESRPTREVVIALAEALRVDVDKALIEAGYAPKALTEKPQTVAELLSLLDRAGVTTITFAEGVDSLHDQPPEALQEILDAVRNAIELTLYKRMTAQEKSRNAPRPSTPPLPASDPE